MKRRVLAVLCAFALMSVAVIASQGGPKPKSAKPPKPPQASVSKAAKPASAKAVKPAKTTTTTSVELTKVQQKLKKNTNLAAKVEGRLPAGTDLMKAADGFKNLGQFVAAVNASHNHEGIEFKELKVLMVDEGYSLGQAMQKLKGENATTEARRAETEANRMIETSEREIAAPTGVTATSKPTTTTSSTPTSSSTTTTTNSKKSKKAVGAQQ